MKKYTSSIIAIILLVLVVIFNDKLTNCIASFLNNNKNIVVERPNEYYKDYNYKYVSNVTSYTPYSYNDLLSIIYTYLNNGWDNFTFYCPSEYDSCIDDVKSITSDEQVLTDINNYVHPFNNFKALNTSVDSSGEINISIIRIYSKEQINKINNKIKEIKKEIYTTDMDDIDKLKAAHDYIIANSTYDINRKEKNSEKYQSNIAYGPLIEGYAICSGYADAMAIFISDLGIKNFKVASDTHVWNAIYIDNEWLHIDPTWDDQIDTKGNESLIHKFFLINTDNLLKYASDDHNFTTNVYREFFE